MLTVMRCWLEGTEKGTLGVQHFTLTQMLQSLCVTCGLNSTRQLVPVTVVLFREVLLRGKRNKVCEEKERTEKERSRDKMPQF